MILYEHFNTTNKSAPYYQAHQSFVTNIRVVSSSISFFKFEIIIISIKIARVCSCPRNTVWGSMLICSRYARLPQQRTVLGLHELSVLCSQLIERFDKLFERWIVGKICGAGVFIYIYLQINLLLKVLLCVYMFTILGTTADRL